MTPSSLQELASRRRILAERRFVLRHERRQQIVLRVARLVRRIGERLREPASSACVTSGGMPFGPARPRNLRTTRSTPCSLTVGTSGNSASRCSDSVGEQAHLAGLQLALHFLHFADADVERAVEHVDHHVAAAFVRHDRRLDAGLSCEPLQRDPFERRGVGGAPARLAGIAPAWSSTSDSDLPRRVRAREDHLRILKHDGDGLERRVAVLRLRQQRRLDVRRRRRIEDAAVRLGLGDVRPSPSRRCLR